MKKLLFLLFAIMFVISCQDESFDSNSPSGEFSEFNSNSTGGDNASADGGSENDEVIENGFIKTEDETTSTFSIDADGGSYSNIRSIVASGQTISPRHVRTEELINYFQYDYLDNNSSHPISLNGEITSCPWNKDHKILRVGIKGKDIPFESLPASNLVLLVDVSGSMNRPEKLPLLKRSLKKLINKLRPQDRVAIVTYASNAGVALVSTSCDEKEIINNAIDKLSSGGSTNGSGGIIEAYEIADQHFVQGGNNRVVLASDGAFNVGITDRDELLDLIEEKREKGIFLTTLGFGSSNFQDSQMEQIANHGNGTYEFIDNDEQGEKVFLDEFGKLYTIAKDVKVQVKFNPKLVEQYRLIGYENRLLNNEDFEDDTKDAGEIGVGQTITALYELIPAQGSNPLSEQTFSIDFRYKNPSDDQSQLITLDVSDELISFSNSSESTRFATAVAGLGMILFDSNYKEEMTLEDVNKWIEDADSYNPHGYKDGLKVLIQELK